MNILKIKEYNSKVRDNNSPFFINRVGEKYTTNQGYEIEIIEYFSNSNCTIRFNTGVVLKNKVYHNIRV